MGRPLSDVGAVSAERANIQQGNFIAVDNRVMFDEIRTSALAATKEKTSKQPPAAHVHIDKVVKVADGDSITVLDNNIQHKIRLQGIDAPEIGQA